MDLLSASSKLLKLLLAKTSVKIAVTKYLTSYRFTPNSEVKGPAELLHGRPVRTILSQLFEKQTESQHIEQKKYSPNQKVFAKNYARGEKWIKAVIDRSLGSMVFILRTSTGFIKRHINQIKPRSDHDDLSSSTNNDNNPFWWMPDTSNPITRRHSDVNLVSPSAAVLVRAKMSTIPAPRFQKA